MTVNSKDYSNVVFDAILHESEKLDFNLNFCHYLLK